ncbi:NUDIX hydrolase [Candidatus Cyanaurora vandensis]|uniref:NUDIX hydrolase n=1 Tax=Candidatus Cyanaurora vandensis TaxID=2714958 RepID=UPI00257DF04A|nr:NUDIX hydrolase [Candidatus Cyanaurora vandensis]
MAFAKPVPSEIMQERLSFTGSKFTFVSQQLRFPNGTQAERQYILHPGGAVVVPVTAEGNFMCIRQYRFAIANYIYEFPAGILEPGELPGQTIRRELAEETGYQAKRWDELGEFYLAPGYSDEVMYVYLARDLSPVAHPPAGDEDEDIAVVEFSPAQLMERMTTLAVDAKTIACFFRAQRFLAQEG